MAGPCFRSEVEKIEVLNTIISGVFLGLIISGTIGLFGGIDVSLLHLSASILLITPLLFLVNSYDNLSAMNPHEILNCINKGEDAWKKFSELSEIEKLEKAYSLASKRAYEAFKASLAGWLFTGFGSAFFWYILANEPVPYNSSIPKITVIGTSLFSFILFVLMIFTYLKHKEYDKELFAIQLKKSDKAEISIKI